ncbi:bifunctional methylenetetrahydrofolate dehydrogenase/methenyltetrahydrofolate cyclohydrolase FolD [Siculibacillus lacustris]|uniref:Bifunctional protein FolD n=1 Tax=Siculibacillus lacustris TaxID=1549641 RepID=A0A4Q9VV04_9HYPH|nr:bifunctional methylenetetrahydrofolate dehydrogenase/methenyltetrahydrofolate cyclohydrolase FolD [Siculibacillus lacustris]TBW40065.1 bifunctional methylenetetrahydrofolate dehydrogenase/methenyltetrahydrofolate cyclohydrolase FolD [Siculibacillus lacustris]
MTARIIDGKILSEKLRATVAESVVAFVGATGAAPGLAVVLVGDDPASAVYVASKGRQTVAAGMRSYEHRLPADTAESDLLALIARLNADDAVDGILVQLPLPRHLDTGRVVAAIDPRKDVDGLHVENAGRLASGQPGLVPCTPYGAMIMLDSVLDRLAGLDAVVVGRSTLVGRPMAQLLLRADCTVTIAHSRTRDLAAVCRRADILVAAVGRPKMIAGDWIKPGATVIDVGINRVPAPEKGEGKTRLVGDVDFDTAVAVAGAITPVPGGVGLMTVATLLANTLIAAHRRRGLAAPPVFAELDRRLFG